MIRRSTPSALRILHACMGRRNLLLLAAFMLLTVSISVGVFAVPQSSADSAGTSITCLPLEHLGYATYDKYVSCRVITPDGMRLSVGYPNKYNGKLGLTPGPTQDTRPFNWGVISLSSPGFDCTQPNSLGLVCNPNGQTPGPIDIGFEAVGDCGTSVDLVAKAVPVGSPNVTYVNDGSWSSYRFTFPACGVRGPVPTTSPAYSQNTGGVTVTCLEQEYLGYQTYDKYIPCRVIAPAGQKFQVAYPAKYNGKLGLTPGPTQDTRPFNWGVISKSTPGWDCVERNSWGLTCTPNGQPAGPVDIGFEAVGDCGTSASIAAKSVSEFQSYASDGSWSRYDFRFPACPAAGQGSSASQASQPAGGAPIITCLPQEYLGYATYDKYVACRVNTPSGMRLSVGYPNKYNGKLGLTPGPTQDSRPFNWGVINTSSPGFDCTQPNSLGLVCNPNGQASGPIDIGLEAVGDCGTSVTLVAKAVPVGSPNVTYVNDGSWSSYTFNFPACPAQQSSSSSSSYSSSSSSSPVSYQCSDGVDNDNDGKVDQQDPGCSGPTDNDEYNPVWSSSSASSVSTSSSSGNSYSYQCSDGFDNDNDGAADQNDFSCSGPTDNDESNPKAACQDGYDNDGDHLVDYPQDPGCQSRQDNDEWNSTGWSSSSVSSSSSSYPWYPPASSSSQYSYTGFKLRYHTSSYEVFPGGIVQFEFTVHNDTDRDATNVVLIAHYNTLLVVIDNDKGGGSNGELRWNLGTLQAGSSRTITYRMRVADVCRVGQLLVTDAEARSDNGFYDRTTATVGVMGTLPQTGNRWNTQSPYLKPVQQPSGGSWSGLWMSSGQMGMGSSTFFGNLFKPFW